MQTATGKEEITAGIGAKAAAPATHTPAHTAERKDGWGIGEGVSVVALDLSS